LGLTILMILTMLATALGVMALFAWAIRAGQFEDCDDAAYRMLHDDNQSRFDI
jgi:cbb3-type cytochrome oxidase maturation protein